MTPTPFSRLLIANRGEIALRVMRSARDLGLATVAVYSDADRDEPHTGAADRAVGLGPAPARDSYLSIPRLLAAARRSEADAVHPGYGFLAEDGEFAQACLDAGLVFVGPDPEVMALMGNKIRAKERMAEAGVPCVPGHTGADPGELESLASELGFPLLVKAAAGGGGRGMRRVEARHELAGALESARREAEAAFGNGELFLERLIVPARHVEVQVLGDRHGTLLHLGERDCSAQRRHQKVVEESPSPAVDEDLRRRMGEAAVAAARAVGYVGAGTVEFLLDEGGRFYFLEMNTRLQVEHPVTEWVTELDLVEWQLRIAAGEPLTLAQGDVELRGHAMEARLYAEDPAQGFLPQPGKVLRWEPARAPWLRVDDGVVSGSVISPHYDPMVAKLVAFGKSRDLARRRLARALEESVFLGPRTNQSYLLKLLRDGVFVRGEATTGWLEEALAPGAAVAPPPRVLGLAAILLAEGEGEASVREGWGWRSSGRAGWQVSLVANAGERVVELELDPRDGYRVRTTGAEDGITLRILGKEDGRARFQCQGMEETAAFAVDGERVVLQLGAETWALERSPQAGDPTSPAGEDGRVLAPVSARVVAVDVAPGDGVEAGQCLVVLEAMKLESRVTTPVAGEVAEVRVAVGDQVTHRQLLVVVDPRAPAAEETSQEGGPDE